MRVFVDSNIPMYVAGRDHPLRDPSRRFLAACHVGLRRPDLPVEVYDLFVGLCSTVFPVTLADTDRARDLVRSGAPASMRDLVHAAVMLDNDVTRIASFVGGFDHLKGIERLPLD